MLKSSKSSAEEEQEKKRKKSLNMLYLIMVFLSVGLPLVSLDINLSALVLFLNDLDFVLYGIYISAILMSAFAGDLIIFPLMEKLRNYMKVKCEELKIKDGFKVSFKELSRMIGIIERAMYAAAWFLGYPQFIALWLTLKVAGQWKLWETEEAGRARFLVFLIGNAFSISFAVIVILVTKLVIKNFL